MLLALGLNVVVGFAGLLDLGYIAFCGFGAYMYADALVARSYGLHWPTLADDPDRDGRGASARLRSSASPSRRLLGDYLAIVTLFFGQAFVFFRRTATGSARPEAARLTGGANGLPQRRSAAVLRPRARRRSTRLCTTSCSSSSRVVAVALYFANQSRTGRAWRALREDPLAAEVMSIPVNRLKILAFVVGAAIAGLAARSCRVDTSARSRHDFSVRC